MPRASATRAATRWTQLMRARQRETDRLAQEANSDDAYRSASLRARRLADQILGTAGDDPLLSILRETVDDRSTVLDVGVGPGRLALPLAAMVREVVAVDESQPMLSILRREARRLGLTNIRPVLGRWEDVEVAPADVAICSYVLPWVEDAASFLEKIASVSRRRVFISMSAIPSDAFYDAFWRHFHGKPRLPAPTYLDAVNVLHELGIHPDIRIVEVPSLSRFRTLAEAVAEYRDLLLLPDTPEVRRELRRLLVAWLQRKDQFLYPPGRSGPAAILAWGPSSRSSSRSGSERRPRPVLGS